MSRITGAQQSKASQLGRAGLSVAQNSLTRWYWIHYHIITIGNAIRLKITEQFQKKIFMQRLVTQLGAPLASSFTVSCSSFHAWLSPRSHHCLLHSPIRSGYVLVYCLALLWPLASWSFAPMSRLFLIFWLQFGFCQFSWKLNVLSGMMSGQQH